MSKLILLLMVLIASGCASRGYNTLSQEVPELFPGFKPENYERKETPKNILYVEKILPKEEKDKKEFNEDEYLRKSKPKSYSYYIPQNRVPSSLSNIIFEDAERIKTTHNEKIKARLIK